MFVLAKAYICSLNQKTYSVNKLFQALIIVLLVAVTALFYLQFKGGKIKATSYDKAAIDSLSSHITVAYVNYDTLWANYEMTADLNKALAAKRAELNATFNSKQQSLQDKLQKKGVAYQKMLQDYESKVKEMSEFQAKKKELDIQDAEKNLQQESQNAQEQLYNLQQDLSDQISKMQVDQSAKVQTKITDYVAKYNQDHSFTLVLAFASGGGILYADSRLDITKDILDGLNAAYELEKKQDQKKSGK